MIVRKVLNSDYHASIKILSCNECGRGGWMRYRTKTHDYRCKRCENIIEIPHGELDLGALIKNKNMQKAKMFITLF